ncbi:hypothetical protein SCFA_890020 [anaerobic digester metagenome]|uniref:Uncharacterized protein n=1 Tax=anaerobic digester metagenome TaxID=1263854 RepID=A0A485M6X7_9ZZZZ
MAHPYICTDGRIRVSNLKNRFQAITGVSAQMMFEILKTVSMDFAGSHSLWAQKVFTSVPENLDLVKWRPLKL